MSIRRILADRPGSGRSISRPRPRGAATTPPHRGSRSRATNEGSSPSRAASGSRGYRRARSAVSCRLPISIRSFRPVASPIASKTSRNRVGRPSDVDLPHLVTQQDRDKRRRDVLHVEEVPGLFACRDCYRTSFEAGSDDCRHHAVLLLRRAGHVEVWPGATNVLQTHPHLVHRHLRARIDGFGSPPGVFGGGFQACSTEDDPRDASVVKRRQQADARREGVEVLGHPRQVPRRVDVPSEVDAGVRRG